MLGSREKRMGSNQRLPNPLTVLVIHQTLMQFHDSVSLYGTQFFGL
jgi:hypothetical protein